MNDKIDCIQQLAFFDITVHGDQAWFCNYAYAAICRMDLRSHEIDLEAFIPDQGGGFTDLYGPIAYYKGNLILAPRCSDRILLYNLSQKIFREIPVSMDTIEKEQRYKLFMDIAIVGNTAYLLPCRYPAVIKLDMDTLKITYYDDWYQELKKSIYEPQRFIFGRAAVRNEHECVFPVWQDGLLMQFDLKTGRYMMHRIYDSHTPFSAGVFDGEDYWVALRNKNIIIKWEQKSRVIMFDRFPDDCEIPSDRGFVSLMCIGEEIIAVPQYGSGNMIVAIDRRTGIPRKVKDILTKPVKCLEKSVFGQGLLLCSKKISENELIVFSNFDGKTLKIDLKNRESKEIETVLKKEWQGLYAEQLLFADPKKILIEDQEISLTEYIKYLRSHVQDHADEKVFKRRGETIFKKIDSLISI